MKTTGNSTALGIACSGVLWMVAMAITGVLGWIIVDVFIRGISKLSWTFLTSEVEAAGIEGGIGPVVVSTLLILMVTLVVSVPMTLLTSVFLNQARRRSPRLGNWIRGSLNLLAAVPSIVFGLFGNALFCQVMGMGYSIAAGGLTLACMALPIMIRTTEQALADVPNDLELGAQALGLSQFSTLRHVSLPAAAPALGGGLVLGIGRALAETAALIFTAGYVTRWPQSLTDSGRAMSVHIYDLALNVAGGTANANSTALVLIILLLLINGSAIFLVSAASDQSERQRLRIRL